MATVPNKPLRENPPYFGVAVWAVTLLLAIYINLSFRTLTFVVDMLGVLCHEAGHVIIFCLSGRPALPVFDFHHGRALAIPFPRQWWLVALFILAPPIIAWWNRGSKRIVIACAAITGTSLILILTGWEDALTLEMGFGGQLLAGAFLLYRALAAYEETYPGERWLYGILGWLLWLQMVTFCWGLTHGLVKLTQYGDAKFGIDNDFTRLAFDHLHCKVRSIARFHLAIALMMPPALVAYCHKYGRNPAMR